MIGPVQRWGMTGVLAWRRRAAQAGSGVARFRRGPSAVRDRGGRPGGQARGITTHDSRAPASSSPCTETTWRLG